MWIDLTIGPHFKKLCGQGCVVWDNCGPHSVPAVEAVAAEWNVKLAPLPKNMTDKLQVMDLVVNSPYKAGLRRERTKALFDYFQDWKLKRLKAECDKTPPPPFAPPKPTVAMGMLMSLKVGKETFTSPTFIAGMRRCFVAVELTKQVDQTYVKYSAHCKGVLFTLPNSTCQEADKTSLGEIAAELDVEMRTEAEVDESDGESDDEDEDEMDTAD